MLRSGSSRCTDECSRSGVQFPPVQRWDYVQCLGPCSEWAVGQIIELDRDGATATITGSLLLFTACDGRQQTIWEFFKVTAGEGAGALPQRQRKVENHADHTFWLVFQCINLTSTCFEQASHSNVA